MRSRKPWYRKQTDAWYVTIDGTQHCLATGKKNKKEADLEFHRLMTERGILPKSLKRCSVKTIIDLFLEWSKTHHEPETAKLHCAFLTDFSSFSDYSSLTTDHILPLHVTRWVDARPTWKSKRAAIASVKRLFSWAEQEGLLKENHLRRIKLPANKSRMVTLTEKERHEVLNAIKDKAFKRFVIALQNTGCRPSEIARVTASDVHLDKGIWILHKHKTGKHTGKPRVIYLNDEMMKLSTELVAEHPTGPLFTTMKRVRVNGVLQERGFSKNGIRCRFRELRKKLPHLQQLIAYAYRHSFATDALEKGVGVAQVAELLGHQSLDMLTKHYCHLNQRIEHLRQAANSATA